MKELFDLSFSAANIIPTGLLVFIILYWLTVLFGFFDFDSFDLDLDIDVDIDVDADVDVDTDAGHAEGGVGWLNHILIFFNLGKVPFMVWLSFVAIPLWTLSLLVNAFFDNSTFLMGVIFMLPILIVTLFSAKFLTYPFVRIFASLDKDSKPIDLIGKVTSVVVPPKNGQIGQADIFINGSYLRIYITSETNNNFKRGDSALIIEKKKDTYSVEPYNLN